VINPLERAGPAELTYPIAHDLAVVRHISDLIGVIPRQAGESAERRPYAQPLHPYTIALMSAILIPTRGRGSAGADPA
jgi:ABC-type oligopeptide transport system ATPase subunit